MNSYDAVIVGSRCAGATLALGLARSGARVLLLDRDTFPSDTVSTHFIFPNSLARLDELGVMDRLRAKHEIPLLLNRLAVWGSETIGGYTSIDGYDRGASITRPVLDTALVDAAISSGAETRFGVKVDGLLGSGTEEDPVRGVRLEGGEEIRARWTFGCDGRASTVARTLGLEKTKELAGEQGGFFAYWRGLPPSEAMSVEIAESDQMMAWWPCEDGIHMVNFAGRPEITRGDAAERERRYAEGIRRFPRTIDPAAFDHAERVSDLRVVPETMVRGFYRTAAGPGWALAGDAGHFKHPVTAQGISDAIEQSLWLADALNGSDPALETYQAWRDDRASGHYELSFAFATWPPKDGGATVVNLLTSDPTSQGFRDVLARTVHPSELFTPERFALAAAAAASQQD